MTSPFRGGLLSGIILGGAVVAVAPLPGRPAIEFLANLVKPAASATDRFLAAALLEGAGDASAVESLAFALKSDKDDMVRRMASHAIAVLGDPAGESPLRAATADDTDWGGPVNPAYELANL